MNALINASAAILLLAALVGAVAAATGTVLFIIDAYQALATN